MGDVDDDDYYLEKFPPIRPRPATCSASTSATSASLINFTRGAGAPPLSMVYSQVPIMVVNPTQHQKSKQGAVTLTTQSVVTCASSNTSTNMTTNVLSSRKQSGKSDTQDLQGNYSVNSWQQGNSASTTGPGSSNTGNLMPGTVVPNPLFQGNVFPSNMVIAPFMQGSAMPGSFFPGNIQGHFSQGIGMPGITPFNVMPFSNQSIPAVNPAQFSVRIPLSNPLRTLSAKTSTTKTAAHIVAKKVTKTVAPIVSALDSTTSPSSFQYVLEPDHAFDKKMEGAKMETDIIFMSESFPTVAIQSSESVSGSKQLSTHSKQLTTPSKQISTQSSKSNREIHYSQNDQENNHNKSTNDMFLPKIEYCYSMKKLSLKQMMELLDQGHNVMQFTKPESKDFQRAKVLCEAVVMHNVTGINSQIDNGFYESLISPYISVSEALLLKQDIENTLKVKGTQSNISVTGKSYSSEKWDEQAAVPQTCMKNVENSKKQKDILQNTRQSKNSSEQNASSGENAALSMLQWKTEKLANLNPELYEQLQSGIAGKESENLEKSEAELIRKAFTKKTSESIDNITETDLKIRNCCIKKTFEPQDCKSEAELIRMGYREPIIHTREKETDLGHNALKNRAHLITQSFSKHITPGPIERETEIEKCRKALSRNLRQAEVKQGESEAEMIRKAFTLSKFQSVEKDRPFSTNQNVNAWNQIQTETNRSRVELNIPRYESLNLLYANQDTPSLNETSDLSSEKRLLPPARTSIPTHYSNRPMQNLEVSKINANARQASSKGETAVRHTSIEMLAVKSVNQTKVPETNTSCVLASGIRQDTINLSSITIKTEPSETIPNSELTGCTSEISQQDDERTVVKCEYIEKKIPHNISEDGVIEHGKETVRNVDCSESDSVLKSDVENIVTTHMELYEITGQCSQSGSKRSNVVNRSIQENEAVVAGTSRETKHIEESTIGQSKETRNMNKTNDSDAIAGQDKETSNRIETSDTEQTEETGDITKIATVNSKKSMKTENIIEIADSPPKQPDNQAAYSLTINDNFHLDKWKWTTLAAVQCFTNDEAPEILKYCYLCGLEFDNENVMWEHILNTHTAVNTLSIKNHYFCTHCYQIHNCIKSVRHHELGIHLCNFPCYFCGMSLDNRLDVLSHIASVHSVLYTCEVCTGEFLGKAEFTKHCESEAHTQKVESFVHICLFCNIKFNTKQNLKFHLSNIHMNKPFPNSKQSICQSCRHTFLDAQALLFHRNPDARKSSKDRLLNAASLAGLVRQVVMEKQKADVPVYKIKQKKCGSEILPPVPTALETSVKLKLDDDLKGHIQSRNKRMWTGKWFREITIEGKTYMYPYKVLLLNCHLGNDIPNDMAPFVMDNLIMLVLKDYPKCRLDMASTSVQDLVVAVSRSPKFIQFLQTYGLPALPWNKKVHIFIKSFLYNVKHHYFKYMPSESAPNISNPLDQMVRVLQETMKSLMSRPTEVAIPVSQQPWNVAISHQPEQIGLMDTPDTLVCSLASQGPLVCRPPVILGPPVSSQDVHLSKFERILNAKQDPLKVIPSTQGSKTDNIQSHTSIQDSFPNSNNIIDLPGNSNIASAVSNSVNPTSTAVLSMNTTFQNLNTSTTQMGGCQIVQVSADPPCYMFYPNGVAHVSQIAQQTTTDGHIAGNAASSLVVGNVTSCQVAGNVTSDQDIGNVTSGQVGSQNVFGGQNTCHSETVQHKSSKYGSNSNFIPIAPKRDLTYLIKPTSIDPKVVTIAPKIPPIQDESVPERTLYDEPVPINTLCDEPIPREEIQDEAVPTQTLHYKALPKNSIFDEPKKHTANKNLIKDLEHMLEKNKTYPVPGEKYNTVYPEKEVPIGHSTYINSLIARSKNLKDWIKNHKIRQKSSYTVIDWKKSGDTNKHTESSTEDYEDEEETDQRNGKVVVTNQLQRLANIKRGFQVACRYRARAAQVAREKYAKQLGSVAGGIQSKSGRPRKNFHGIGKSDLGMRDNRSLKPCEKNLRERKPTVKYTFEDYTWDESDDEIPTSPEDSSESDDEWIPTNKVSDVDDSSEDVAGAAEDETNCRDYDESTDGDDADDDDAYGSDKDVCDIADEKDNISVKGQSIGTKEEFLNTDVLSIEIQGGEERTETCISGRIAKDSMHSLMNCSLNKYLADKHAMENTMEPSEENRKYLSESRKRNASDILLESMTSKVVKIANSPKELQCCTKHSTWWDSYVKCSFVKIERDSRVDLLVQANSNTGKDDYTDRKITRSFVKQICQETFSNRGNEIASSVENVSDAYASEFNTKSTKSSEDISPSRKVFNTVSSMKTVNEDLKTLESINQGIVTVKKRGRPSQVTETISTMFVVPFLHVLSKEKTDKANRESDEEKMGQHVTDEARRGQEVNDVHGVGRGSNTETSVSDFVSTQGVKRKRGRPKRNGRTIDGKPGVVETLKTTFPHKYFNPLPDEDEAKFKIIPLSDTDDETDIDEGETLVKINRLTHETPVKNEDMINTADDKDTPQKKTDEFGDEIDASTKERLRPRKTLNYFEDDSMNDSGSDESAEDNSKGSVDGREEKNEIVERKKQELTSIIAGMQTDLCNREEVGNFIKSTSDMNKNEANELQNLPMFLKDMNNFNQLNADCTNPKIPQPFLINLSSSSDVDMISLAGRTEKSESEKTYTQPQVPQTPVINDSDDEDVVIIEPEEIQQPVINLIDADDDLSVTESYTKSSFRDAETEAGRETDTPEFISKETRRMLCHVSFETDARELQNEPTNFDKKPEHDTNNSCLTNERNDELSKKPDESTIVMKEDFESLEYGKISDFVHQQNPLTPVSRCFGITNPATAPQFMQSQLSAPQHSSSICNQYSHPMLASTLLTELGKSISSQPLTLITTQSPDLVTKATPSHVNTSPSVRRKPSILSKHGRGRRRKSFAPTQMPSIIRHQVVLSPSPITSSSSSPSVSAATRAPPPLKLMPAANSNKPQTNLQSPLVIHQASQSAAVKQSFNFQTQQTQLFSQSGMQSTGISQTQNQTPSQLQQVPMSLQTGSVQLVQLPGTGQLVFVHIPEAQAPAVGLAPVLQTQVMPQIQNIQQPQMIQQMQPTQSVQQPQIIQHMGQIQQQSQIGQVQQTQSVQQQQFLQIQETQNTQQKQKIQEMEQIQEKRSIQQTQIKQEPGDIQDTQAVQKPHSIQPMMQIQQTHSAKPSHVIQQTGETHQAGQMQFTNYATLSSGQLHLPLLQQNQQLQVPTMQMNSQFQFPIVQAGQQQQQNLLVKQESNPDTSSSVLIQNPNLRMFNQIQGSGAQQMSSAVPNPVQVLGMNPAGQMVQGFSINQTGVSQIGQLQIGNGGQTLPGQQTGTQFPIIGSQGTSQTLVVNQQTPLTPGQLIYVPPRATAANIPTTIREAGPIHQQTSNLVPAQEKDSSVNKLRKIAPAKVSVVPRDKSTCSGTEHTDKEMEEECAVYRQTAPAQSDLTTIDIQSKERNQYEESDTSQEPCPSSPSSPTARVKKYRKQSNIDRKPGHSSVISQVKKIKRTLLYCGLCGLNVDGLVALSAHMKEEHTEDSPTTISCSANNYKLKSSLVKCDMCWNTFQHQSALDWHLFTSHRGSLCIFFRCRVCRRSFNDRVSLQNHLVVYHKYSNRGSIEEQTERYLKCPICSVPINTDNSYRKHYLAHFDTRNWNHDPKEFPDAASADAQSENYVTPTFSCKICHKNFDSTNVMDRHMEEVHNTPKEFPDAASADTQSKNCVTPMLICKICDKSFNSMNVMDRHIEEVHNASSSFYISSFGTLPKASKETVRFNCPKCTCSFVSVDLLSHHMSTHAISSMCSICHKELPNEESLEKYSGTYMCHICGDGFEDETQFTIHMIRNHGLLNSQSIAGSEGRDCPVTLDLNLVNPPENVSRQSKDNVTDNDCEKSDTNMFKCRYKDCKEQFDQAAALVQHFAVHAVIN